MFTLNHVTKNYSQKKVLADLSFDFKGQKMAFVGLNGVGKTTTMNIILGVDKEYIGDVKVKYKMPSVQFSKNALPEYLSINEFCAARKIKLKSVQKLANKLNVEEYLNTQIRFLSFGTQVKMNLIYALVQESDFVFLDEPTNGLDYESVYNLIKILNQDSRCFFIISHDINFIESVCDYLCVLHDKKIIKELEIGRNANNVKEILNDILEDGDENIFN